MRSLEITKAITDSLGCSKIIVRNYEFGNLSH